MRPKKDGPSIGEARTLFRVYIGAMFFAALGLLVGYREAMIDLSVCVPRVDVLSLTGVQLAQLLYRLSILTGFVWLVLFVIWWRRDTPWLHANPVAFSRVAWAGLMAWNSAVHELRQHLLSGPERRGDGYRWLLRGVLGLLTVATAVLPVYWLVTCTNCPTSWNGSCVPSAGGPAASILSMVFYCDARIKFHVPSEVLTHP